LAVQCQEVAMPTYDFSKPETQALYAAEVRKRMDLFGMTLDQASMLVAALMTEPPPRQHVSDGVHRFTIPNSGEKK
jgi:hypothetical protein